MHRFLKLHQVSKDEFVKSYKFYLSRPDIAREMFDSLATRANRRREELFNPKPLDTASVQQKVDSLKAVDISEVKADSLKKVDTAKVITKPQPAKKPGGETCCNKTRHTTAGCSATTYYSSGAA